MIISKEEAKEKRIGPLTKEHGVEFFDFGCSNGGSIESVKSYFKCDYKGMGFDIAQDKLETASERGHLVTNFDVLKIPDRKMVRFTTLFHILEHIDSQVIVKKFLQKACEVSREFVFLKQPYFDADPYLFRHGLKLYWSDWHGHPNRMTSLEMYLILSQILAAGTITGFKIFGKKLIPNSACSQILPLNTRIDQHDYDPEKHPPKRTDLTFDIPVYYELAALIEVKEGAGKDFIEKYRADEVIYSTS